MITNGNPAARWLRTAILACAGVLALAGCVKVDMTVTVNSDDTVSGTLIIAFDKEVLAELGGTGADPLGEDPIPGVTSERPYDDGTFQGVEYVFENTPLSQFNDTEPQAGGDYFHIVHEDGEYRLSGVIDQTYDVSVDGSVIDEEMAAKLDQADLRVQVTFPGQVVSGNGTLSEDGRTMSWRLKLGERTELSAVAGPGPHVKEAVMVLGVSTGALLLVGLLLFVQLRRRSLGSRP